MAGMPIPKCYGRPPPIAPTVIDGDKIARKVKRKQGGKGSTTVTEQEGFIATRAFLVCEGEIAGYARIHRNGKLVYSTVPGDELDAQSAAFNAQITIYTGTQTQGPDPSLEALHGVGNTPYYRGRSYFVVRDDDETQTGGAANQYRIEVAACGDVTPVVTTNPTWFAVAGEIQKFISSPGGYDWSGPTRDIGVPRDCVNTVAGNGKVLLFDTANGVVTADRGTTFDECTGLPVDSVQCGIFALDPSGQNGVFVLGHNGAQVSRSADGKAFNYASVAGAGNIQRMIQFRTDNFGLPSIKLMLFSYISAWSTDLALNWIVNPGFLFDATESAVDAALDPYDTLLVVGANGSIKRSIDRGVTMVDVDNPFANPTARICSIQNTAGMWVMVNIEGEIAYGTAGTSGSWAISTQTIVPAGDRSLHGEDGLFVLGGLNGEIWTGFGPAWTSQPNPYSGTASRIYSITGPGPLRGMALPDASGWYVNDAGELSGPGSQTISECAAEWRDIALDIAGRAHRLLPAQLDIAHMTDIVPGFTLGNASLTGTDYMRTLCTLYFADGSEYDNQWHAVRRGGAVVGTLDEDDLLTIEEEDDDTRDQALKGFKRVTVMYPDPANNYVPTPQTAPRTSPDVTANNEITIECPIPFDADTMAQKADILQKIAFLQLEGSFKRNFRAQYSRYVTSDPVVFKDRRYILNQVGYDDSMVRFEGIYDRVSAYTSLAAGNSGPPPERQQSNLKGPTIFAAMNLPRLRTEDNVPGMYVAVCGILDGWPGADLYLSTDGGVSEQLVNRLTNEATIGKLAAACTASSEPLSVTLYPHGELSSITPEQLAARQNAFAITTAAVQEVGQFQTADQTSSGDWELTDTIRGALGTVATSHALGDQFVLLDSAVYFIPLDSSLIGQTIRFHPVTIGTAPANNAYYDVVFLPLFTGPETIAYLLDETGAILSDESGGFLLE